MTRKIMKGILVLTVMLGLIGCSKSNEDFANVNKSADEIVDTVSEDTDTFSSELEVDLGDDAIDIISTDTSTVEQMQESTNSNTQESTANNTQESIDNKTTNDKSMSSDAQQQHDDFSVDNQGENDLEIDLE